MTLSSVGNDRYFVCIVGVCACLSALNNPVELRLDAALVFDRQMTPSCSIHGVFGLTRGISPGSP
jgi:hypothetical protein